MTEAQNHLTEEQITPAYCEVKKLTQAMQALINFFEEILETSRFTKVKDRLLHLDFPYTQNKSSKADNFNRLISTLEDDLNLDHITPLYTLADEVRKEFKAEQSNGYSAEKIEEISQKVVEKKTEMLT